MKICVATQRLLSKPELGGHAWVYLNWILGFEANGCDVIVLESVREPETADVAAERVRGLLNSLRRQGSRAQIALIIAPEYEARTERASAEIEKLTVPLEAAFDESDLLFNFYYTMEPEIVGRFRRTALIDIDPGLLQLWLKQKQLVAPRHDEYFTTGETIGALGSRIPDCGIAWRYTPPAVSLQSWPETFAGPASPYSTITNWWAGWEEESGQLFNNEKRTSFLDYLELPSQVKVCLELALYMENEPDKDQHLLERNGWVVRNSAKVCSSPERYRAYIQSSRGEFSCAKPSCMRFQNAWVSDRTLCYLASGKPAVVQHTGPSGFLPDAGGLFRFRDLGEAAAALRSIESDYEGQCQEARNLAQKYFDATMVVGALLDRVMQTGSPARAR